LRHDHISSITKLTIIAYGDGKQVLLHIAP
jgi:hypothetical protein